MAPVLLLLVGGALDYAQALRLRSAMQSAADAAALAAARELSLVDQKVENASAIARAVIDAYVRENSIGDNQTPHVQTSVADAPLRVTVALRARPASHFAAFGLSVADIAVQAIATIAGRPNICVLALEAREASAISLESDARLTGNNCAVFSNSAASMGIAVRDRARLKASTVCSAGGVSGRGSIAPDAYTDCPQFDDPLASRPEPQAARCDHLLMIVVAQVRTLKPGVYCGGLTISGLSRVTFEPGVYVIKNGPFTVTGLSEISGDGVGFFLSGVAFFVFDPLTKINLSAPRDGLLAGLLFFGSRTQSTLLVNTILSNGAQVMNGTIYLPRTLFVADSLAQIGAQSAYTAIVARRLVLMDGPNLVLNTNYDQTDIPVPDGIKAVGQPTRLLK